MEDSERMKCLRVLREVEDTCVRAHVTCVHNVNTCNLQFEPPKINLIIVAVRSLPTQ